MNNYDLTRNIKPIRQKTSLLNRFILWLVSRGNNGKERLRRLGNEATLYSHPKSTWAVLHVLDKDNNTYPVQIPITKSEFILGRRWEDVDYCFAGTGIAGISRVHAAIIRKNKDYYIMDKNSSGGTFINGSRIENGQLVALQDGDIINLYNVRLLFEAN